ncbi:MAG: polyphosphate kinase 2 family protein [Herminiimonas sp.]|nr:polyphosphate kinase 2 family protein [Herminiimonas sp.]
MRSTTDLKITEAGAGAKPMSSGDKIADRARTQELAQQIAEFQNVFYAARARKIIIVLQGMDTSGKDGTVKGVFSAVDPLGVRSVAFKAPTTIEREHDFLWRVHSEVPAQGEIAIFNRSHYEDVLITRVHGWIDDAEAARRFAHIRDFERMLAETGTVILKFFLHISSAEQKLRLEERLADPEKHWKFDPNDLEERKAWADYQDRYRAAIRETDADHAPWYVIPADSKTHRNLAIATIVADTMKDMNLAYPDAHPEYLKMKVT